MSLVIKTRTPGRIGHILYVKYGNAKCYSIWPNAEESRPNWYWTHDYSIVQTLVFCVLFFSCICILSAVLRIKLLLALTMIPTILIIIVIASIWTRAFLTVHNILKKFYRLILCVVNSTGNIFHIALVLSSADLLSVTICFLIKINVTRFCENATFYALKKKYLT